LYQKSNFFDFFSSKIKKILDKNSYLTYISFTSYRRDPSLERRGAEGASLGKTKMKLSGKRTVTKLNPGKI
jgi:hypothetical protein